MDFYDFGGGFYFTLLAGIDQNTYEFTGEPEDAGWLIGEGALDDGKPTGAVKFYPYLTARKNEPPVVLKWDSKTKLGQ